MRIFSRDLKMIKAMGANTVRLYSFKTSVRHGAFLDLCLAYNISAMVAFEIGSAKQTPLATSQDLTAVKARLRRQIRMSSHPAIILWLVGNEMNGAWHLYVCDSAYAQTFLEPKYGLTQCQFGSDARAFMKAIDTICSVPVEEGYPCSTPLADVPLPAELSSLPQYDGRGALGWMKLMDGSSEAYMLHHMSIWSLNIYPGRNFTSSRLFENYQSAQNNGSAPKLPVLITEYGIDALDTDAWYAKCIVNQSCPYGPSETNMQEFVDERSQADWVLSLVEDLERHATTCTSNCHTKTVAGGTLIAWVDEAWKGRVIDSVESDARTVAMTGCPDPLATAHTACGYPSAGQFDTYVNEEWYGFNRVVQACSKHRVDQIQPRLVYYGLRERWSGGSCTPHLVGPKSGSGFTAYNGLDQAAFPYCGSFMIELREFWLANRKEWLETEGNATARSLMPQGAWLAKLEALDDLVYGDSDCALMDLLHEFDGSLCPKPPARLLDWAARVLNSSEYKTAIAPSVCEQEATLTQDVVMYVGLSLLALCVLFSAPHWVFLRGASSTRLGKNSSSRAMRRQMRLMNAGRANMIKSVMPTGMRMRAFTTRKTAAPQTTARIQRPEGGPDGGPAHAGVRPSLLRRTSLSTSLEPSRSVSDSAELRAARALVQPIGMQLTSLFGFQTLQMHHESDTHRRGTMREVRSSSHCAIEHVSALLAATLQRLDGGEDAPPPEERLRIAMLLLHRSTFDTYHKWVKQMATPKISADAAGMLHQLVLWYLIWGEAANVRHMPECLCLILHVMSNSLVLTQSGEAEDPVEGKAKYCDLADLAEGDGPLAPYRERSFKKPSSDGPSTVGGLPRKLRMPQFVESALSRRSSSSLPPSPPTSPPNDDDGDAPAVPPSHPKKPALPKMGSSSGELGYPAEDYLNKIITPLFYVLELQVALRAKKGPWSSALADRPMYDDINEFFWQRENVDRLLGGRRMLQRPGEGYAALRDSLARGEEKLSTLFRKTFWERPTWLSVLHAFQRVFHFNAIALHVMATYAFTDVLCDAKADVDVSEVGAAALRLADYQQCIEETRGGGIGWKLVSYATVTHAVLQVLFFLVGAWVKPIGGWVCFKTTWRSCLGENQNLLVTLGRFLSVAALLVLFALHVSPIDLGVSNAAIFSAHEGVFHIYAVGYSVVWAFPLLQLPLPLPGYTTSWCGIAPQWMTRVPLATMAQYSLFWVVTIAMKWSFEYFLVIKPLALPITALWEANYRCWETGHTGSQPCIWSPDDSEALRVFRDWALRLILVTLRSAVPILLSLGDMPVFYMITLSVTSTLRGRFMKIGSLKSWPHVVSTFFNTQLLFVGKCLYTDEARLDELDEAREVAEQASRTGDGWSAQGCADEWHAFATSWNALILSLRARDLLSNPERDDLVFDVLESERLRLFFGSRHYCVLPAMISSPIFTSKDNRSLVTPSTTRYAALIPVAHQLRDLLLFVLVEFGILEEGDVELARGYVSRLFLFAEEVFSYDQARHRGASEVAEQRQAIHKMCGPLANFISKAQALADDRSGALLTAHRVALGSSGECGRIKSLLQPLREAFAELLDSCPTMLDDPAEEVYHGLNNRANSRAQFRRRRASGLVLSKTAAKTANGRKYSLGGVGASGGAAAPGQPVKPSDIELDEEAGAGDEEGGAGDEEGGGAFRRLCRLLNVRPLTDAEATATAERLLARNVNPVLTCLWRALTTINPGGEPVNPEAKRQIISFCSSLRNTKLATPPRLSHMRSLSVLVPHFKEEVAYSMASLMAASQDNTTLLTILRALHPDEYDNLRERIGLPAGELSTAEQARIEAAALQGALDALDKGAAAKNASPQYRESMAKLRESVAQRGLLRIRAKGWLQPVSEADSKLAAENASMPILARLGSVLERPAERATSPDRLIEGDDEDGFSESDLSGSDDDESGEGELTANEEFDDLSADQGAGAASSSSAAAAASSSAASSAAEQKGDRRRSLDESSDPKALLKRAAREARENADWAALQAIANEDFEMPVDVDAELQRWASDRAQVLSRTVRGVMLYADALRIQARLEGLTAEQVDSLVAEKFQMVVSCQVYGSLRESKQSDMKWKAKCIDELRHRFPTHLKLAYIQGQEDHDGNGAQDWARRKSAMAGGGKQAAVYNYYSILLGVDPSTHEEQVLYKVKLPGNPIIGEGKPENQNHAVIFTRGECLQTLDMNQDNYLGESYKLRNMLQCFTGNVRLVGCREHIFSEAGGAVAAFAASNEFAFGTVLQRFMTSPLCVRFHYGHPDVWDKVWTSTNGGVSKASKMLHLSEDIFAGFNVVQRGGSVVYREYIHVGKGRDVTFVATNGFEQKISGGNALQCISRDVMRLADAFDLPRLLSFWCSAQGFFISSTLIVWSAYVLALTLLVLAMLRMESYFPTPGAMLDVQFAGDAIPNLGTSGGEQTMSAEFLLQIGFLMILPLVAEEALDMGLRNALGNQFRQQLSLRLLYAFFQERTKASYFDRALQLGEAKYVATGRSYDGQTSSFVHLYKLYARTHLASGAEMAALLSLDVRHTHRYNG